MGNGNSNIHIYNNSNYYPYGAVGGSGQNGYIGRGGYIKYGLGQGEHDRNVTVTVRDSKNRIIKCVNFSSGHNDSWIVRNDGVKRQAFGAALHVEDPHGAFYRWTTDNEDQYNREDQEEAEKQREAEAQRQKQIEKEKDEMRAQDVRSKANHEIISQNNRAWADNHQKLSQAQDLKEFSQTNSKFVVNEDVQNIPLTQLTHNLPSSYIPNNIQVLKMAEHIHHHFSEIAATQPQNTNQLKQAEREMLHKLQTGDNLLCNYSNLNIQILCLDAFQNFMLNLSDFSFIAFCNAFSAAKSGVPFEQNVDQKISKMQTKLRKKWIGMMLKMSSEVILDLSSQVNSFGDIIIDPLLTKFDFPEDLQSIPVALNLLRNAHQSSSIKKKIYNLMTDDISPTLLDNMHRDMGRDLLEILATILDKDSCTKIIRWISSLVNFLQSCELNYYQDDGGQIDEIACNWILKAIEKAATLDHFDITVNPMDSQLVTLLTTESYSFQSDGGGKILEYFVNILTASKEDPFQEKISALLLRLAIAQGDELLLWTFPPDFLISIICDRSYKPEVRKNLINCAQNCGKYLRKLQKESINAFLGFVRGIVEGGSIADEEEEFVGCLFLLGVLADLEVMEMNELKEFVKLCDAPLSRTALMSNNQNNETVNALFKLNHTMWTLKIRWGYVDSDSDCREIFSDMEAILSEVISFAMSLGEALVVDSKYTYLWDLLYLLLENDNSKFTGQKLTFIERTDHFHLEIFKLLSSSGNNQAQTKILDIVYRWYTQYRVLLPIYHLQDDWFATLQSIKVSHGNLKLICSIYKTLFPHHQDHQLTPETSTLLALQSLIDQGLFYQTNDAIISICELLIHFSQLPNFDTIINPSITTTLLQLFVQSNMEIQEILVNTLCSFNPELLVEHESKFLAHRSQVLASAQTPLPLPYKQLLKYIQDNHQNNLIANSPQFETHLVTFLDYLAKFPELLSDTISFMVDILLNRISISPIVSNSAVAVFLQASCSTNLKNVVDIQLNLDLVSLPTEILTAASCLFFVVQLYRNLSQEEVEQFKKIQQIQQTLDSTSQKFIRWTTHLIEEEEQDKSQIDLKPKNTLSWISEWYQNNPNMVYHFLKDVKSGIPLNLNVCHQVELFCLVADQHFSMEDDTNGDDCHLSALKLIQPDVVNLDKLEVDFVPDEVQIDLIDLRNMISINRAKILTQHGDYKRALNILKFPSQHNDPDALSLAADIIELISFLDQQFPQDGPLRKLHDLLTLHIGQERAKVHLRQLYSKLGIKLLSSEGDSLIELCLQFGNNYDLQVVQNYKLQNWAKELLRSEFSCKIISMSLNEEDVETFNDLFDSLMIFHDCFLSDNFIIISKIQMILSQFPQQEEVGRKNEELFILLICLQIPLSNLESCDSASSVQKAWLECHFPDDVITEEQSAKFWTLVLRHHVNGQNLMMVQSLVTKLGNETSLEEFQKILESSSLDFLKKLVNPFYTESLSMSTVRTQVELGFVHFKIDEIFQKYAQAVNDEKVQDVHDEVGQQIMMENCLLLCRRMCLNSNFDSRYIKNLLELCQIKMTESESEHGNNLNLWLIFVRVIHIVYSYQSTSDEYLKNCLESVQDLGFGDWPDHLSGSVIENLVRIKSEAKGMDILWEELVTVNEEENNNLDTEALKSIIQDLPDRSTWSSKQIREWAETSKGKSVPVTCSLSILKEAVFRFKTFYPRDTQLLSFIVLLSTSQDKNGRLAKIATGEGKSVIVAMLASYWALEGKKVDIVTSSPILAERDAKEFAPFYSSLGLTVSDISGPQLTKDRPKDCYLADITYGDSSMYEGDILRHEFSLLNTRGTRQFDVVIIDEVDSMLIDQGGHSTRLVDKMPGMEHLETVFVAIWMHLNSTMDLIFPIENQSCFMDEVKGAQCTDYLDVLAKVTGKWNSGDTLRASVQQFTESAKENDLKDHNVREAMRTLIEAGVYGETNDESPDDSTSIDENTIDDAIRQRWSLNSDANFLQNTEKILMKKVHIYTFDPDHGIFLSPTFHNNDNQQDEEDEEFNDSGTKSAILLIQVQGKFYHLLPLENENKFIIDKIRQLVLPMFVSASSDNIDTPYLKIPPHLYLLFQKKLIKWIESAITARCHVIENRDYLIKYDEYSCCQKVVPIDFESTGILQEGTVWSDGLHQFLQLKHQLGVTPEHLATNFLSNLTFFQRFGSRIYGLTGTLGSEAEKNLVARTYKVDTVNIPQFKTKRHLYMEPIVVDSTKSWLSAIATSILIHLTQKRPILIICKSIKDVDQIHAHLSPIIHKEIGTIHDIEKYTRSDNLDEVDGISKEMLTGTIIIATNLAGRGTDIKLSKEVVSNGGLHVCITFLPTNLRVEHQATGRASRGGQPGTSQLIINGEKDGMFIEVKDFLSPGELKFHRDLEEQKRIEKIQTDIIPRLEIDQQHFAKYCGLRNQIYQLTSRTKDPQTLAAADERWGLALDISKNESGQNGLDLTYFDTAFAIMAQQVTVGILIRNPYYYILKGIDKNADEAYIEAMYNFDSAITMDKIYSINAFYYKAYSIINHFRDDYKDRAVDSLTEAAKLIANVHKPVLVACQTMGVSKSSESTQGEKTEDSDFVKQIVNKIRLLEAQFKSIEQALDSINKHKEVKAEMVGLENYFQENDSIGPAPKAEIEQSMETGLIGFIKVVKKPPPWWAIFVIIFVGFVQVIAGAVLAVCTGGSFGTGLISDGMGDIVIGIKAAIDGEYICLKEFYKDKAIGMAISALAAGVGAALSAAAKTVSTFIKNIGMKFLKTGVGQLASKGFNAAKRFIMSAYEGVKKLATKALNSTRGAILSTMKSSLTQLKTLVTKISPKWLQNAGRWAKQKLVAAWTHLKNSWTKMKDWTKTKFDQIGTKIGLTPSTKDQLKLATKLIGSEVVKTGLLESLNIILDKTILEPMMEAIQTKLKEVVYQQVEALLQDERNGGIFAFYFARAKSESAFDALWIKLATMTRQVVEEEFERSQPSEAVSYLFKGLEEFARETKRIMGGESQSGYRKAISTIGNMTITAALESTKFGMVVDGLRKFVPSTVGRLMQKVEAEGNTKKSEEDTSASYFDTTDGANALDLVKKKTLEHLAEKISEQMTELIKGGIIMPPVGMSVGALADKINPIKNDDIWKDLAKWKKGGNPERNPEASMLDIIQGRPTYVRQNDSTFDDNFDKQELRMMGDKMTSKTFVSKNSKDGETTEKFNMDKENLKRLSAASRKCVQVYRINDESGEIEIESMIGSSSKKDQGILRVLATGDGMTSLGCSQSTKYDPIIEREDGSMQVLPLKSLVPSMGGAMEGEDSLLTSEIITQSIEKKVGGRQNLDVANFVKTYKSFQSLRSSGRQRIDSVQRLASFTVHDD